MKTLVAAAVALLCCAPIVAQAQAYGPPITLEQARKVWLQG